MKRTRKLSQKLSDFMHISILCIVIAITILFVFMFASFVAIGGINAIVELFGIIVPKMYIVAVGAVFGAVWTGFYVRREIKD